SGSRILVLAAHQDDETIGAGGTFLLCARAGASFSVIYYTDGSTALGGVRPEEVRRWRRDEACAVWRRIAGVVPTFWDYPNRAPSIAPDAGARLAEAIASFGPDTIFVPNFFEQPEEHRRLNDVLLAADSIRPIAPHVEIWGYQITTRLPGNRAVDITAVWKEKYAVNRLWATQNAYMDYAHLAMGRDIANSYYLKGGMHPRHAAAHAEVFLTFDAPTYLQSAKPFSRAAAPPPDFLVIGMQKSGSYWLTALLDAHPSIRCFPSRPGRADGTSEAHLFDVLARLDADFDAFRKSMRSKLDGFLAPVVPDTAPRSPAERDALTDRLRARFNEYCQQQRERAGKPIVGEKTTETVHHPDLVERLYPGIRKVCILRDPRDRAVSFFFHQQRKGRTAPAATLTADQVREYIARVEKDYRGLLRMTPPLHVLTYERLSAAPRDETRRLLAFLGVEADDAVLDAMVRAASFEALSGRPSGDPDPSSHFRQGIAGAWAKHLPAALADEMIAALEPLTRQVEARCGVDLSSYRRAPEPQVR
ncbi:MAG TPA: sulfotransferase domain-containing protein, partial [Vicinamibacterales bacterium]|nr:sulfotransferase domain-containing protein [Vicinamibacterales bacterium]